MDCAFMMKRVEFKDGTGNIVAMYDCDEESCDVSYDGVSITGHLVTRTDPRSGEGGQMAVKSGERMPVLGRDIPIEAARTVDARPNYRPSRRQ